MEIRDLLARTIELRDIELVCLSQNFSDTLGPAITKFEI